MNLVHQIIQLVLNHKVVNSCITALLIVIFLVAFYQLIVQLNLYLAGYGMHGKLFMESQYVTLMVTVPEAYADLVRHAMGQAGAGTMGDYSYCSFSSKGIGRCICLNTNAKPFGGTFGRCAKAHEEMIQTICHRKQLAEVIEAIKYVHPYETLIIDIIPIYRIGIKNRRF